MNNALLLSFLFFTGAAKMSETVITADNQAIHYAGRVELSDKTVRFDWPGIYIQTQFEGTSCKIIIEGRNTFDITIDNGSPSVITVGAEKDTFSIADNLSKGLHSLKIAKRSESNDHYSTFYGFILDKGCKLQKITAVPDRRIEFIGDSYTAGFGNEHAGRECAPDKADELLFTTTNTNKAFGPLIAAVFNCEYQINAYSGKGLARNYNGIDKGKEFLSFYDRTLQSTINTSKAFKAWDYKSWHPHVAVIGIGINDFQADPPYADSTLFDSTYAMLINKLRSEHKGVKIICCATQIWPKSTLIPRIQSIVSNQKSKGNNDIWYFEYKTENTALYGHPSIEDHKNLARQLSPLIAEITGWDRK